MAKRRTLDEQIAQAQKELEQKEARMKELLGRQRTKADKERTHRLCRRGGLVEKFLPELATITDEQFDIFMEKCLLTDHTREVLTELAPPPPAEPKDGEAAPKSESATDTRQSGNITAPKPTDAAAQGNTAPAQKPAGTPHNGGNNGGGNNQPHNAKPANTHHNNGANGNSNGGNGAHRSS